MAAIQSTLPPITDKWHVSIADISSSADQLFITRRRPSVVLTAPPADTDHHRRRVVKAIPCCQPGESRPWWQGLIETIYHTGNLLSALWPSECPECPSYWPLMSPAPRVSWRRSARAGLKSGTNWILRRGVRFDTFMVRG